MLRRLCVFFIAAVSAGIFVCGCGPKTEKTDEGKVTLNYGVWEEHDVVPLHKEIIRRFEEKYPNIKVRAQYAPGGSYGEKLKIQLAGGSAPDLWMTDGQLVYNFAERKVLKNLTEWFQRDMNIEDYYCIKAVTDDNGSIWAVPYSFQSFALFYNKDMFDEAGLSYPTEEWTWADMIKVAKELTKDEDRDGRIDRFGLDGHSLQYVAVLNRGIRCVEEEDGKLVARYDTPEFKEALGEYVQLRNIDKAVPSEAALTTFGRNTAQLFAQKRLAMCLTIYYGVSVMNQKGEGLNYDVTLPPRATAGAGRAGYYLPNCFGITASSSLPQQEAAWEFIKFFSSYEIQKLFGRKAEGFPFLKTAARDLVREHEGSPEHIGAFLASIEETVPYTPAYSLLGTSAYAESEVVANVYISAAVVGNMELEEACRRAQKAAQRILDQ